MMDDCGWKAVFEFRHAAIVIYRGSGGAAINTNIESRGIP